MFVCRVMMDEFCFVNCFKTRSYILSQVMRPGYTLNGRVLRSAQVGVAENPSMPFEEDEE